MCEISGMVSGEGVVIGCHEQEGTNGVCNTTDEWDGWLDGM